jgi:hypothetical protein
MKLVTARLVVAAAATLAGILIMIAPGASATATPSTGSGVPVQRSSVTPMSNPASCDALYNSTNGYALCFWPDEDYVGPMGHFYDAAPHWSQYPQSWCPYGDWADCAGSVYNSSYTNVAVLWDGDGAHGAHRCLAPRAAFKELINEDFAGSSINMDEAIASSTWIPYSNKTLVQQYCG